jgi:hypothetical protein
MPFDCLSREPHLRAQHMAGSTCAGGLGRSRATMRTKSSVIRPVLLFLAAAAVAPATACKKEPAVKTPATASAESSAAADVTFLDKMEACQPVDQPPEGLAARGGDGAIIAGKGDCQFQEGISCHFHTSMEFVTADRLQDDGRGVGEMHCIVPSGDANSPTVYGAHVRCKQGTKPADGKHACSNALLQVVERGSCHDGWKCCDNGTLTKPVGKQAPAELKLRPDFRICQDDAIEVDCAVFVGMHGHTANVVGLGEEYTGTFNAGDQHARAH